MTTQLTIKDDLFPNVFKDIDTGIFFAESKIPNLDSMGHIQLVLDNNVLNTLYASPLTFRRLTWILGGAPNRHKTTVSLNLFWPIAEQYLSNPDSAEMHIKKFTSHAGTLGAFPASFATELLREIKLHENSLRDQLGLFTCYLFVLRELYQSKLSLDAQVNLWLDFFRADIPRLALFLELGLLFFYGKHNSKVGFNSTKRTVQDWAQSVLSTRKEEAGSPTRWARNRIFDIMPFCLLNGLTNEIHGGIDSRVFLLSRDADVGECFLRIFSWARPQVGTSAWMLQTNFSCLHSPEYENFRSNLSFNLEIRSGATSEQLDMRRSNLVAQTLTHLQGNRRSELLSVLHVFRFAGLQGN
jgi:hypothetical protein